MWWRFILPHFRRLCGNRSSRSFIRRHTTLHYHHRRHRLPPRRWAHPTVNTRSTFGLHPTFKIIL
ncbi:hypothetical protein HanIR_Chr16g0803661 [Helianthus annuus]|nr:hypothetical protein HanIR_Chr16g0803661 [Helianthus annuus]